MSLSIDLRILLVLFVNLFLIRREGTGNKLFNLEKSKVFWHQKFLQQWQLCANIKRICDACANIQDYNLYSRCCCVCPLDIRFALWWPSPFLLYPLCCVQMQEWVAAKQKPGQFTGSTKVQTLSQKQLGGNDPRAWVKKVTPVVRAFKLYHDVVPICASCSDIHAQNFPKIVPPLLALRNTKKLLMLLYVCDDFCKVLCRIIIVFMWFQ